MCYECNNRIVPCLDNHWTSNWYQYCPLVSRCYSWRWSWRKDFDDCRINYLRTAFLGDTLWNKKNSILSMQGERDTRQNEYHDQELDEYLVLLVIIEK